MNLAAAARQYENAPDELGDRLAAEAEAYQAWAAERTPDAEATAYRDFLEQLTRACGVITGTFDAGRLPMATVTFDGVTAFETWDMRTNWKGGAA